MTDTQGMWAGAINGIHAVFDPSIQLEGSRWILLFLVAHARLVAYERAHARSISRAIDLKDAQEALETYERWRQTQERSTIEAAIDALRVKDETTTKRIARATAMHQKRLEKRAVTYRGVIEPTGRGYVRTSECHDCHRPLGGESHLECAGCHWIVCSNCGACGCTWKA